MSLKLSKYLKILKTKADRFERTDINGNVDESFYAKYCMKALFGIISISVVLLLGEGFNDAFVSFASSILSILVGLFITTLVFSFDKFYQIPIDVDVANSKVKLWDKQDYNYSKKFAYITSYTIVLSVFALVMLTPIALFKDALSLNILSLYFDFKDVDGNSVTLFFRAAFSLVQRFLILYWMMKIMYNTLFIVSSMVQFMTTKIDR